MSLHELLIDLGIILICKIFCEYKFNEYLQKFSLI